MAACHEVGDGVDGGGARCQLERGRRRGSGRGQAELGQLAQEEGREEGMGWAAAVGREEGENEPVWLFPISNSLFYFLTQLCICLNDFKFKFECMSV